MFDAAWYRARYCAAGIDSNAWVCALHHYLTNDDPLRSDPSPRFSEAGYLALHADIRMAVQRGDYRNGYDHVIRHGHREGRYFLPASATAQFQMVESGEDPGDTMHFAPQTQQFETVTLLPIDRDHTFGMYDRNGRSLPAFRHPWLRDRPLGEVPPVTAGEAIFGGLLMSHFGYVLRDSLSRLWFLRQRPDLTVLWRWIDLQVPDDAWPGWMEALFRMVGLDKHRYQIIRAPMTMEKLILPDSGLPAPNTLHPLQARILACQPPLGPHRGRRIWLSRHTLPDRFGRMIGEDVLEDRLRDLGWTVICPETLPVSAQVDLFATEAVVAGFIGSAFHAVLLAQTVTASLILVTRPLIDRTFYDASARTRRLKQVYIEPPLQPIEKLEFWGSYLLADARALADAVQVEADLAG
ncbi:MAG: glycosyltransferase 61 family protein [Rhodopila sp.]